MIDNIKNLKPFLLFNTEDDFYFLQILQRKKEHPDLGSNSHVVKNYYIRSVEDLDKKYVEIKSICTVFNARAMLRLNKRSFEKVAYKALINMANTMENRDYSHIKNCYDRACGQSHNAKQKKWIIDIDNLGTADALIEAGRFKDAVEFYDPVGLKVFAEITSPNGFHFITSPFNVKQYYDAGFKFDIHKDNPTNLFIP